VDGEHKKSGYPAGYPLPLQTYELAVSTGNKGRQSWQLYLIVFKPNRFPNVCPFKGDIVEAKWLLIFTTKSNRINLSDGPSESPKGSITHDLHVVTYLKDGILHASLISFLGDR
jgi:hypothetical protein